MNDKAVIKNFLWRFAERSSAQIVSLIVSIFLARILDPKDFGTVSIIMVFVNILSVFVDSGFSEALIQKKEADELDFSTIFVFNIFSCILLYVALWFGASYIAVYYENPELNRMVRTMGLLLLISGVKSVQVAYVSRNMMFKRFFYSTIGGTLVSAVIGVFFAYRGYGAWALIFQNIINNFIDSIILWTTVKWRPQLQFSFDRFKGLFKFGGRIFFSYLLGTMYENVRALIIGKTYSSEDLAFYSRGESFPKLIVANINSSIDSVLLPTMSKKQSQVDVIREMTRKSIKVGIYILAPMMTGLAACSTPLTRLLLSEKWLDIVPFQIIFCITYMFYPIHTANLNALKAMGRSDLFLKLEIWKKVIGIIVIIISSRISVMAMGYSLLLLSLCSQIINSWPNKKILNYGYRDQIKDVIPSIFLAGIMALMVLPISKYNISDLVKLIVMIPCGVVIYVGGSVVLRIDSFFYIFNLINNFIKNKRNEKND